MAVPSLTNSYPAYGQVYTATVINANQIEIGKTLKLLTAENIQFISQEWGEVFAQGLKFNTDACIEVTRPNGKQIIVDAKQEFISRAVSLLENEIRMDFQSGVVSNLAQGLSHVTTYEDIFKDAEQKGDRGLRKAIEKEISTSYRIKLNLDMKQTNAKHLVFKITEVLNDPETDEEKVKSEISFTLKN